MNLTGNCVRGCGTRSKGGVYLCVGLSKNGRPIEEFLIDPLFAWDFHRGFKIVLDPSKEFNNVLIFVGQEPGKGKGYKHFWQFVEESRNYGISRKVTPEFPFEQLTPGKSKMIFCHMKTIPLFNYDVDEKYPDKWCRIPTVNYHNQLIKHDGCVYEGRDLSMLCFPDAEVVGSEFEVKLDSYSYKGIVPTIPEEEEITFAPGFFMVVTLSHVEFPFEENQKAKERANKAGYETVVTEW